MEISELKVTLHDLEGGMDPNDYNNLFSDNSDNIEANAINSVFTRHPPSGKRLKTGGV